MTQIRPRTALLALVPLLLIAGFALAQSVHDVYKSVTTANRSAPSFYRADLDGSDSETYSSSPGDDVQPVKGGDTTLVVVPRHSASTSTAQIEVGLYSNLGGSYSFLCVADVQTSTSAAKTDGTGYYPLRPLYFPLNGAQAYVVRCTDVSTGTVSLKAWTIGAASAAAE